jgi:hypothetical protein
MQASPVQARPSTLSLFAFIKRNRKLVAAALTLASDPAEVRRCLAVFSALSVEHGGGKNPRLLTEQEDVVKLQHNAEVTTKLWQVVMYLLPHSLSGVLNVCPWSTRGCRSVCLHTSGRLGMPPGQRAQLVRTLFLAYHPLEFMVVLVHEIRRHREPGALGK